MESRFNRRSLEEAYKRKTGGGREIGKEGTEWRRRKVENR